MRTCTICGNEIEGSLLRCPYCGSSEVCAARTQVAARTRDFLHKTVNLEQGLPTVQQALRRLQRELDQARQEGVRVLTLIHGYGSSGKGGAIRLECRRTLEYLLGQGELAQLLSGEDFSRRNGATKHLLHRFPKLQRHPNLNTRNRGITLVVLP